MKFGIERFIADLQIDIAADVLASHEGSRPFDSPIEKLFYTCLWHALECHPRYRHLQVGALDALTTAVGDDASDIYIGWQVRVLDWPVDFAFKVRAASRDVTGLVCLAVECDGHDFHERTKEQAARDRSRDRALQAAGYTVMRFTGSELYRDPMKCVREVLDWAYAGSERF